ncbi:IS200/IS605 family accessory protein TnpB-related protein [Clostridium sp. DJ247]|uniref:IS200/IS605 family accessory protein TnpB-related protein n=1 Tax=Clostridium sp. DJ247 TaxID=2726188 RepID=UPI00162A830E|nr:IS200/IS605 family accessory protein TnpB-related protein [Clostridium sp. DJ247]MBC2582260.1 IS200/IS605 family element transposase accessory protein TnpB [Clostridium sp. DJ247]
MYLCIKQQLKKISKEDYENLRELSHVAKNLYNYGLYNVRQYYFEQKEYLNYEKNYAIYKNNENYKLLNSNMAQQVLKEVDGVFKSFFGLIKLAKKGKYNFRDIKLPKYLKKDGFATLVIGFVRIKGITKKQSILRNNRNNRVNDYINKTCRYIINYCLDNNIGNLVIGYNETLQRDSNLGKVNNQNFVNIPVGNIKEKLEYLCKLYGINFVKQEESYTSKASFFDNDNIPKYNADNPIQATFSGKRIKRGLYKTKSGYAYKNKDCINF